MYQARVSLSADSKKKLHMLNVFIFISSFIYSSSLCYADSVFHLSADKELTLQNGIEIVTPEITKNVKLIPGITGKAVYIPKDGLLKYPSKSLFNPEKGTVSLWLKLDKTPSGMFAFRDRDRLENGDWGSKLHGSVFNRYIFYAGGLRMVTNSYININGMGTFTGYPMLKQIFSGEWHNIVYTWKKGGAITLYLDGIMVTSKASKHNRNRIGKTLTIGSGGRFPGIEGAIDDFKIYQKVLTPKQIFDAYAKIHPIRYELLDYALDAGKENKVRFRVRNISTQQLKKTVDVAGTKVMLDLKPNELKEFIIGIKPKQAGLFKITCNPGTNDKKVFEAYALAPAKKDSAENYGAPKLKLIQEINCAESPKKDEYTDAGTSHIVKDYRESTSLEPGIGFAYRMRIPNPGKPYWLEVEYPDDAIRSYIVFVYPYKYKRIYTTSLDNIGIITGGDYPITGKNHTKRLLFWPDSDEIAVAVVSYKPLKNHSGPAAAKLRLYENVGPLPVAKVPEGGRCAGLWQEDPTMTAGLWFNHKNNYKEANLEYWRIKWSRVIDYMRYNGFNTWIIQTLDYNGDVTFMNASLDITSKQMSQSARVPGWAELGAAMMQQQNLGFYARLNPIFFCGGHYAKPWFFRFAEISDPDSIKVVNSDGTVNDGFRRNANVLHPAIQKGYKKIIRAYRDKYSKYSNFKGICFNEHNDFSLIDLKHGYGDFSCSMFEKETGIKIPASTPSGRYNWLMKNAKKQWIDWRCKKVTEFAAELGRTIQEKGNKKFKVQLWVKADRFLGGLEDWPRYDANESLRTAGIDLAELNKLPGITVVPIIRPDYTRVRQRNTNEEYLPYSPELKKTLLSGNINSINVFRHSNMEIYPSLISKSHRFKPFWHPAGNNLPDRICKGYATPLPSTEFALSIMTYCLAEFDLQLLLHGWWGNPENGEHEAFRKFYTRFRNIPAGHYDLAPGTNDPVAFRVGNKGFYMVNREGFPVTVKFKLNGKEIEKQLSGSEVFSKKLSSRPIISNVKTTIPQTKIDYLNGRIKKLNLVKRLYHKSGKSTKNLDYVIKLIDEAMTSGCYSRVRYLMLTQAARSALSEIPVSLNVQYDWLNKTLDVTVSNIDPKPFSGTLSIKSFPKSWTVSNRSFKIDEITCGETKTFTFKFDGKKNLSDHSLFKISLKGVGISKEYQYRFPCRFASERDFERLNMSGAWVSSDWHLLNKNGKYLKQRIKKRVIGRYMLQWDRKGSGLRVVAQIDDADFIPPTKRGQMYLADSIQIYFDQKNNACIDAIGYDGDDVVFQIGMLNGKPEVYRETGDKGVVNVPVKIDHKNGKTTYDLFIPKTLLPQADLRPGNTIGFGILFNQLMKDGAGEFMVKLAPMKDPYLHPGHWQDFYLSTRRPNAKAKLRLTSHGGSLKDGKAENCKLKVSQNQKSISAVSAVLEDSPQEFSITFTPDQNGAVTVSLEAAWMSRVKFISISAQGAELLNGNFSVNEDNPKYWKMFKTYKGNMDIPYGQTVRQVIKVKKDVPVTITAKAVLPEESK